jgi:hypothetical protein
LEETALLRQAFQLEIGRLLDEIDCRLSPSVRDTVSANRTVILHEVVALALRAPIGLELGSAVLQERIQEWNDALTALQLGKRRVGNTWAQHRRRHGQDELGEMQEHAEQNLLRITTELLKEAREDDLPGAMTPAELEIEIDAFILKMGRLVSAPGFIWALLNALAGSFPMFKTAIPPRETIKKRLQRQRPDVTR